jgi:hypothetical protein
VQAKQRTVCGSLGAAEVVEVLQRVRLHGVEVLHHALVIGGNRSAPLVC